MLRFVSDYLCSPSSELPLTLWPAPIEAFLVTPRFLVTNFHPPSPSASTSTMEASGIMLEFNSGTPVFLG